MVSRRQFGKSAALLAVAGTAEAAPADLLSSADRAAVKAKYENVIRKYGGRLSPAQRVRTRETLVQHQRMLARIRDFALENSDAPATGFRLYPDRERKGRQ